MAEKNYAVARMKGWRSIGKFYHAVNVNQERYPEQALCGNTPKGVSH